MIEATRRRRAVNRDGKNANRPAMYRTTAPMITKPPFPIDDDIDSGDVEPGKLEPARRAAGTTEKVEGL